MTAHGGCGGQGGAGRTATGESGGEFRSQRVSANTPGPFKVETSAEAYTINLAPSMRGYVVDSLGCVVAIVHKPEDATRIVACVNACEGMDDPAARIAEMRVWDETTLKRDLAALRAQRDELAAALRPLLDSMKVALEDPEAGRFFGEENFALAKSEVAAAEAALAKAQSAPTTRAGGHTREQAERYIRAADLELGPECVDAYVESCRRAVREAAS